VVAEWKYPHASHFRNVRGGESDFATTRMELLPHFGHEAVFVIFSDTPGELQDQFPRGNSRRTRESGAHKKSVCRFVPPPHKAGSLTRRAFVSLLIAHAPVPRQSACKEHHCGRIRDRCCCRIEQKRHVIFAGDVPAVVHPVEKSA